MSGRRLRSVAVYVHGLRPGGAERNAAVLASGFHAAGFSTTLIVDDPAGENAAFVAPGVTIVPLNGNHAVSTWRLARWLAVHRPDAVLAIDAAASLKLATARMLGRAPCRIVLSFHGYHSIVRGRLGRAAYHLAPLLGRMSDRIVGVSAGLAQHLVRDFRAPASRVVTVPNPITVEEARPPADAADLARRPPTIVAVGRLVPEKNFAGLIDALDRCPPDTRLTILGEGPERAALEARAARFGGRVSLPGHADPWAAYAAARVFALSSTSEAFGNVVVEALASGLPVVATACGGPDETLAGGRYGRLVPIGDPEALAAALNAALAEPGDPAPRIARAAEYDTARVVETYRQLFEELLTPR
jgi:glycosyltransferase involved in cell wall biosynthesis